MNLITGDPSIDFFEQNPELKYLGSFKELYNSDKYSYAEKSKIAWSIYLMEDPTSKFFRIPRDERKTEIETNYFEGIIDWEDLKNFTDSYSRLVLNKEQALFKIWADKLDELTAYLKSLNFDVEKESLRAERIMKEMDKIWRSYEKVRVSMIEAEKQTRLRGGATESVREKSMRAAKKTENGKKGTS